VTKSKI